FEATVSASASGVDISLGNTITVNCGCLTQTVIPYSPDPNPAISALQQGGTMHRFYQVVDAVTRMPRANAQVQLEILTPRNQRTVRTLTTNADGIVVTGQDEGVAIAWDTSYAPNDVLTVSVVDVDGVLNACGATAKFAVAIKPREFQSALRTGASL